MPSKKDHIDKARHNEKFYSSFDLDTTPFLDWVVNGIFYSALHYVDSYFESKGIRPGNHRDRNELILTESGFERSFYKLYHNYRHLQDDSEGGRYKMQVFASDEIRRDIIPKLNDIKTHLKRYVPEI